MNFKEYKERVLWKLKHEDKSNEGKIDDAIKDTCSLINTMDNYVTLSSCAGRISVVYDSYKKRESIWLFKTHNELSKEEMNKIISSVQKIDDLCWLRLEPFILHVAANNTQNALKLIKIAQISGIKHAGIISINQIKTIMEIQSVERMNLILSHNKKVIIDDFDIVINKINQLLKKTRERLNLFYRNIIKNKNELMNHDAFN